MALQQTLPASAALTGAIRGKPPVLPGTGAVVLLPRTGLATLVFVAAMLLAGCGGDGGRVEGALSSPPPDETPEPQPGIVETAEGVYGGTTSEGLDLTIIVLENQSVWALQERNEQVVRFVQGNGVANGGSFTAANAREYDFTAGITRAGALGASYFAGLSIEGGFVPEVGVQYSFTATTAALTGLDYDRPASLSAVEGSWQGFYGDGAQAGFVDVSAAGEIVAITSLGCTYTGRVTPRASGRNIYDLGIVFGGPPCAIAGRTASGIAVVSTTPGTDTRRFRFAVIDASREFGMSFAGRQ